MYCKESLYYWIPFQWLRSLILEWLFPFISLVVLILKDFFSSSPHKATIISPLRSSFPMRFFYFFILRNLSTTTIAIFSVLSNPVFSLFYFIYLFYFQGKRVGIGTQKARSKYFDILKCVLLTLENRTYHLKISLKIM